MQAQMVSYQGLLDRITRLVTVIKQLHSHADRTTFSSTPPCPPPSLKNNVKQTLRQRTFTDVALVKMHTHTTEHFLLNKNITTGGYDKQLFL